MLVTGCSRQDDCSLQIENERGRQNHSDHRFQRRRVVESSQERIVHCVGHWGAGQDPSTVETLRHGYSRGLIFVDSSDKHRFDEVREELTWMLNSEELAGGDWARVHTSSIEINLERQNAMQKC